MANVLSKLAKYASNVPSFTFILHVHRQANYCSETFFWNSLSEPHLRHLQSSVAVFNEQFRNIEKTKASIVEVVSCRATAMTTIQERESDVRMKLSEINTTKIQRRKQRSWLRFINVRCVCIVQVLCCISGKTVHFICWISMLCLNSSVANNWMGKCWNMWIVCVYETFLLMKLNCLTNTKTCLSSYKKSIKQMQFILTWWNMKDGQNIL